MSNIRKGLAVISFAIPVELKEHLDRRTELDGFSNRSDLLRKLLLDYTKENIGAEGLCQILSELQKMEVNRL